MTATQPGRTTHRAVIRWLASLGLALSAAALSACGTSEHIAKIGLAPPSSSPTTETATPGTPSSPGAEGDRVQEDGFSLVFPPGWHDDTDRRSTDQLPLRLALYRDVPTGHRLIFEVHYGDSTVYPSQIGSAATRKSLLDAIENEVHGKVLSAPDLTIDGELAVGVRTIVHRSGLAIAVRYYIPSHFTVGYPILMAYVVTDQRLANQGFRSILASWRWAR